jgi:hypothetical protein
MVAGAQIRSIGRLENGSYQHSPDTEAQNEGESAEGSSAQNNGCPQRGS